MSVFTEYVIFFTGTVLLSFLLNTIFLKFAKTLGIRNQDETIMRWATDTKPALGGISFFILFLISYFIFDALFDTSGKGLDKEQIGFIAATGVAFVMGLSDDAFNTRPVLKFLVQVSCGIILIISGTYIQLFPSEIANYALTVFWVVAVMNSINMLDNMDAITATVSFLIICIALQIVISQSTWSPFYGTILIGTGASLLGFLYFNWNPSKMFMGDTGSQFLGIFLATIGIIFFWNFQESDDIIADSKQLVIVLLAFIVPIADTGTVIINRLRRGQSPFVGGRDHTTHHLSYLGLSDRQVALLFIGISLVSFVFIGIIVNFIEEWSYLHFTIGLVYFLLIFLGLFSTTQVKKAKEKFNEQLKR